jgi:3-oxoacyl-[acyl-carrier-protein] synthase-3
MPEPEVVMPHAYITGMGVFLPNAPVGNDRIEDVLGRVGTRSSQVKRWVLDYNGIQNRYYAIDPETGKPTHTNAEMTTAAIRAALDDAGLPLSRVQCLSCGTSSADQVLPNHAVMVHGELGSHAMEVVSTAGVCASGMTAFKYAFMNVASGQVKRALATGSELASISLRASHFKAEMELKRKDLETQDLVREPMLAFENDFLRWMLSDGAGAWVLSDKPRDNGLSLRVDWIDITSFANEAPSCMYYGAAKRPDGSLTGFRLVDDPDTLIRGGYLSLCQDVEALRKNLPVMGRRACVKTMDKHNLSADQVDWFLPHYSSKGFRQPLFDSMKEINFEIPFEKWFTNLEYKGNTGSASIYIILQELVASGRAKRGDRILCFVPESSRFSFAILHLTVV